MILVPSIQFPTFQRKCLLLNVTTQFTTRSYLLLFCHLRSGGSILKHLSSHKNLKDPMTTKMLNQYQARWVEVLFRFDFKITFRPEKSSGKPDSLTRLSGDLPKQGDELLIYQFQTVLSQSKLSISAVFVPPVEFIEALTTAYISDPFSATVVQMLKDGVSYSQKISLPDCTSHNGHLYFRGRLYIPDFDLLRLMILRSYHDSPSAGHPGVAKTFNLIAINYFWPGMREYIKQYIRHCHTCSRIKSSRHAPYGNLRPLSILDCPWNDLSMDFITGLPESNGCNAILVVVDRLTKMAHFIPYRDSCSAEDVALLYRDFVWKLYGLPQSIISDCGPTFVSAVWRTLCTRLSIQPRLNTAFHSQTDSQTE